MAMFSESRVRVRFSPVAPAPARPAGSAAFAELIRPPSGLESLFEADGAPARLDGSETGVVTVETGVTDPRLPDGMPVLLREPWPAFRTAGGSVRLLEWPSLGREAALDAARSAMRAEFLARF